MQDDATESAPITKKRFRVSMGDVLFLFVCVSVALTVAVESPPETPVPNGINVYQPHFYWHYALLSIATVGAVTSLLEQRTWIPLQPSYAVARSCRAAAAGLLVAMLFLRLLVQRNAISLPENKNLFLIESDSLLDFTWLLLLIAALLMLGSIRSRGFTLHGWRRWFYPGTAVLFLLAVSSHQSVIVDLVYIAMAGINAAMGVDWQSEGAYPNHAAENYFTYWTSMFAVGCLLLCVLACQTALNRKRQPTTRILTGLAAFFLLASSGGYSVWFWRTELARISPDFFEVGPAGRLIDFAMAAAPAALLCLWLAIRQQRKGAGVAMPAANKAGRFGALPAWLAALGALSAASVFVIELLAECVSWFWIDPFGGVISRWDVLVWGAQDKAAHPTCLMFVALLVASWRLIRVLWRQREVWVSEASASEVGVAFAAYLLVALVAAPTLAAYSFSSWLGPWYW